MNDTEGYSWESFSKRLGSSLEALFGCYGFPSESTELRPQLLVLRYINALVLSQVGVLGFLRDNLHTSLEVEPPHSGVTSDEPSSLNLRLSYPMNNDLGDIAVSFSTGQVRGQPALIWQLEAKLQNPGSDTTKDGLLSWATAAHTAIEDWFLTLSAGDLLTEFKGEKLD